MTPHPRDEIEAVKEFAEDIDAAGSEGKEAARGQLTEAILTEDEPRPLPRRTRRLRTLGLFAGLVVIPTAVALAGGIGGDLASEVIDSSGARIGVDPAFCPEAVAALRDAGIPEDEQPTVYPGRCPTSSELEELVPQLRELQERREALGR